MADIETIPDNWPQPLSKAEEAELRAILEEMSSAPWYIARNSMYFSPDNPSRVPNTTDDCKGIVALRNAAPRMLATIAELRAFARRHYDYEANIHRGHEDIGAVLQRHGVSVGIYPTAFTAAQELVSGYACEITNLRAVVSAGERVLEEFGADAANCASLVEAMSDLRAAIAKVPASGAEG